MGRAYSQDFRERVLAEVDDGTPVYEAAVFYRVSVSFIYKLLMRRAKTGQVAPATVRGRPPRKLEGYTEALRQYVCDHNDATLHEIQEWLAGQTVQVSIGALWHTLEREDLSYKKNRTRRRAGA